MCCPTAHVHQEDTAQTGLDAGTIGRGGLIAWVLSLVLLVGLLIGVPLVSRAHPADLDSGSVCSTSQLLARAQRSAPLQPLGGAVAADPRSDRGVPHLDIAAVRVEDGDELVVTVELYEAATPGPEGLAIHLAREGDVIAPWIAYQPEGGEWALYQLDTARFSYLPIGAARFEQDGTALRVAIPRADIPADSFLVFARTVGGPDIWDQVEDVAPNQRRALLVSARPAGSSAPGVSAQAGPM